MLNIARAWSAFIDDKGKFAENATFQEPDLKWFRETYAGGGMSGEVSIPMLMEEMKAELGLYNYDLDAMNAFGITVQEPMSFQFRRELFDSNSQQKSSYVIHTLASIDLEFPEWERRRHEGVKLPLFIKTYRRFVDGVMTMHIDPENGIIDDGNGNLLADTNRIIGRT